MNKKHSLTVFIILALFLTFSNSSYAKSLVDKGIRLLNSGDPDTAFKLFKKSCDSGDMKGCEQLGTAYVNGSGVEQNCFKASYPLKKACDHKLGKACIVLSLIYSGIVNGCNSAYVQDYRDNSPGLDPTLLRFQACLQSGKDQATCRKLASESSNKNEAELNRYVKPSDSKSAYYAKKGCDCGIAVGCLSLGNIYLNGTGVKQSQSKALYFFKKACREGNSKGCRNYENLKFYSN